MNFRVWRGLLAVFVLAGLVVGAQSITAGVTKVAPSRSNATSSAQTRSGPLPGPSGARCAARNRHADRMSDEGSGASISVSAPRMS